jgi:hypothetical protein
MKVIISILMACGMLTGSASASLAASADEYSAIAKVFQGGGKDIDEYVNHYTDRILRDLQGKWTDTFWVETSGFSNLQNKSCSKRPTYIKDVTPYAFTMVTGTSDVFFTTKYILHMGNTFSYQSDIDQWFKYIGFDAVKNEQQIKVSLRNTNGLVTIIRPSPDFLVFMSNYGPPQIYTRCP